MTTSQYQRLAHLIGVRIQTATGKIANPEKLDDEAEPSAHKAIVHALVRGVKLPLRKDSEIRESAINKIVESESYSSSRERSLSLSEIFETPESTKKALEERRAIQAERQKQAEALRKKLERVKVRVLERASVGAYDDKPDRVVVAMDHFDELAAPILNASDIP